MKNIKYLLALFIVWFSFSVQAGEAVLANPVASGNCIAYHGKVYCAPRADRRVLVVNTRPIECRAPMEPVRDGDVFRCVYPRDLVQLRNQERQREREEDRMDSVYRTVEQVVIIQAAKNSRYMPYGSYGSYSSRQYNSNGW